MTALRQPSDLLSVLDSMPMHVALVDGSGRIRAVNNAWRRFAAENGGESDAVAEGVNYLQVCDRAEGEELGSALQFARGMRGVLSGRRPSFSQDYPCHGPGRLGWYRARVEPFSRARSRCFLVSHADVTEWYLVGQSLVDRGAVFRCVVEPPPPTMGVVELAKGSEDLRFFTLEGVPARGPAELGLPEALIASWRDHARDCLRDGTGARFLFVEQGTSTRRLMTATLSPIPGNGGDRQRLSFVVEDCTDWCPIDPGLVAPIVEQESRRWRLRAEQATGAMIHAGIGETGLSSGRSRQQSRLPGVSGGPPPEADPGGTDRPGDRFGESIGLGEPTRSSRPPSPWLVMAFEEMVGAWLRALECHAPDAFRRLARMSEEAVRLALSLGLADDEIARIRRGVQIREVCRAIHQDRQEEGARGSMLEGQPIGSGLDDPEPIPLLLQIMEPVLGVLQHRHERWDGLGTPDGLQGEEIPVASRVFAVVDCWEELSAFRANGEPLGPDRLRIKLAAMAGSQLDPLMVARLLELLDREQAHAHPPETPPDR